MQQRYARVSMMSHADDDDLKVYVQKAPQGHVDSVVSLIKRPTHSSNTQTGWEGWGGSHV